MIIIKFRQSMRVPVTITGMLLATILLSLPPNAGAVDEIFVTVRKREENLQTTPVAVSAFNEEALADRQIQDINDIARYSPGLNFARAFGRTTERPVIRGLGNVLAGVQFGVESGAAYFVDGIYYPGDLQSLNIKDVERVEVIRGPQSALYGRNTYSGAINFITKSPGDVLNVDAGLRFGQDGEAELSGAISGPLIDGILGAGLSARFYNFDGEYPNIVTGQTVGDEETKAVSGTLSWTPIEDLAVRSRFAIQRDRDGTRPFFLQPSEANNCFPGARSNASWTQTGSTNANQYFCGQIKRPGDFVALNDGPSLPGQPGVPVPGIPDILYGPSGFFPPGTTQDAYNTAAGVAFSGVDRDLTYGNLSIDWDVMGSGYTLTTLAAIRDEERTTGSDSDHSAVNYIRTPGGEASFAASEKDEVDDYSVEIRLESPDSSRLSWLVGAFTYDQTIDTRDITFTQLNGGPVLRTNETENWAVFGSLSYDVTDTVAVSIEGRYFDETKKSREPVVSYDEKADFSDFAPRITVDWLVNDELLLYANYAKGFKPGGLNGNAGAQVGSPVYDQEESDNYEIGAKSRWFDDRLTANVALFYIDAKDIQLTTALSNAQLFGALTSIVTNQGSGEIKGFEVELTYALTDAITLGANYALADSEFTEGCDDFQWQLTSGGGNIVSGDACNGNNVNGLGNGSIIGNQFPLSAKHQAAGYVDFRTPIRGDWEFVANTSLSWEDKKPVQVHNLAFVPSATLLDARIGVDTGTLSVSLYGRNLLDEDDPSMATRWLQVPLASYAAGGVGGIPGATNVAPVIIPSALPGATNSCAGAAGGCATNFPRAFFADMRRSRNFGVEFAYRFGGDR